MDEQKTVEGVVYKLTERSNTLTLAGREITFTELNYKSEEGRYLSDEDINSENWERIRSAYATAG